jgi:large subunit ribosomal protein L4
MTLDVVNVHNEKVGAIELADEVFGQRVKPDLIWASVVREQAARRRGTHKTKTRAEVSGSGRKPWRQKGTGRARAGEIRSPLWRHGGTVFGPVPRSYAYTLPRKMERAALRSALTQKLREGAIVAVDALTLTEAKTRAAAELLGRLGARGRTLVVDVQPGEPIVRAMRNLPGVSVVASAHLTARDVIGARSIVATTAALTRLQAVLGARGPIGDPGTAGSARGLAGRAGEPQNP